MPRLEQWSTCRLGDDPYVPPEMSLLCLQGQVFGHARKGDGTKVTTSPIVAVDGRVITTASGSVYELGEPDPGFLAWLAKEGRTYDPGQPITLKGRSK